MQSSVISIIIPAYNIENYILDCLHSLARQTYHNLELLIIDDGSTDRTGILCDEFAANSKHPCRVIHQKNSGLSAARNAGLRMAKGELVAFIDGDDTVAPQFLEKLVEGMDENTDIVVCGYLEKGDNFTKVTLPPQDTVSGVEATKRLLVCQENYDIVAWNKLYRKSLFINSKIEYPIGDIHEDSLTTYKLYASARRVKFCGEPLYIYRRRAESIMSKTTKDKSLAFRERAAREAIAFFAKEKYLQDAAKIALLTAKFAYLDSAIRGEIDQKYGAEAETWIKQHKADYLNNPFLTKKLRLYLTLGKVYRQFRKVKP